MDRIPVSFALFDPGPQECPDSGLQGAINIGLNVVKKHYFIGFRANSIN